MFSQNVKESLKKEFQKLIEPVVLTFYDKKNKSIKDFLKEISSLSEKIEYEESHQLKCVSYPCISVQTKEKDYGIRFVGTPDGGEFPVFIESIVMVSRNRYDLTERTVKFLEEIKKPIEIKIFVTKNCGWCPPTILKIFSFAVVNKDITATVIDCYEFPDIAMKYNVSTVPKVIINDKKEFIGFKEENEILGYILGAVG